MLDCSIAERQGCLRGSASRGDNPECSCPDYEARRQNCKHIYAAIFVSRRERHADGSTTVTETIAITRQQTTYPQAWPAYNAAQTNEKDKFQSLLSDLCRGIAEPIEKKAGRPRLPLSDAVFSAVFKVYSTVSGRRFMSDLRDAQSKGFIASAPHYNSIFNYLENPAMTPILRSLVEQSSLPLPQRRNQLRGRFFRFHNLSIHSLV